MITGGLTSIDGVDHYRIDGVEEMEPFLTTVVSAADLWMFVSSTGSLTAGRIDADHALFPYVTDDQIHRSAGYVGPATVIARQDDCGREIWRPFHREVTPGCTRAIAKSVLGDRLIFEEHHPAWGLRFRATWAPSARYGWVRSVELIDEGDEGSRVTELDVLDGLLDVMPAGVDALTEQIRSNLVNAYKRSETGPWGTLAIYNVESLITDRAEPAEALTATTVWSWGFDGATVLLDAGAVADALDGRPSSNRQLVTGRPGAYLLRGPVTVPPRGRATWSIVADTGLGHAAVAATVRSAADPDAEKPVLDDVAAGTAQLGELLAAADAFQTTADPVADAHHLSNVLFNSMRGGVFPDAYRVERDRLADFVARWNRPVAQRHAAWFDALDERVDAAVVRDAALATGDPDLVRIVLEYLPLTFSRRHGDPSRPWNRFSIRVRDDEGRDLLAYEGNWRDIFQNWEALLRSFPAYHTNVVAKFVNASTIEGYNPYRISQDGVDWEVPDPHDPWSNIGYWGDHQITYLLRLLEAWDDHDPGAIAAWFERPVFVYADVPYRLADHAAMVADPRNTVEFDHDRAARIAAREEAIGSDGRLLADADGAIVHVGLVEKLLVPALGKLSSFVPGGGIWMNTQRPEWNDANNALAGPGLSMVTLYHLDRYLRFLDDRLASFAGATVRLTSSVATWLSDLATVFERHTPRPDDERERRIVIDALGEAAGLHRARMRESTDAAATEVPIDEVRRLLRRSREHLAATFAGGRRDDALYHSYNLISFPSNDRAEVEHLGPMLEGQVAALSSGTLAPADAVGLIDALFDSGLYRVDLDTFLLYPAVALPRFLDRNAVPESAPWTSADLDGALGRVFAVDPDGRLRFRPGITNAEALDALLDELHELSDADRAAVRTVYEEVFRHHAFTGRSGSMYGYEGLGSVYWHMVSKLLLAVQETYWAAVDVGEPPEVVERLRDSYRRVRAGLGFGKDPATFGAFPTDCYSHTPTHAGAQQPGMTGQVKEEVLTRFGELGLRIRAGRISLTPGLLPTSETVPPVGSAMLTLCSTPMAIAAGPTDGVEVVHADGTVDAYPSLELDAATSRAVLGRAGAVVRVTWTTATTGD